MGLGEPGRVPSCDTLQCCSAGGAIPTTPVPHCSQKRRGPLLRQASPGTLTPPAHPAQSHFINQGQGSPLGTATPGVLGRVPGAN